MTTTTRKRSINEAQWMEQVTDLAQLYDWTWAHFRPARTEQGWRTPVAGPGGAGFPDLVLWRDRVIFAELKTDRGVVRGDQHVTLYMLKVAQAEVYVWRPKDFELVRQILAWRPDQGPHPAFPHRPPPDSPRSTDPPREGADGMWPLRHRKPRAQTEAPADTAAGAHRTAS